jgi:hypothetical protein
VLVIRVLFSTAVYLLTASEQGDSKQELDNLDRVMKILLVGVDRTDAGYRDRFPLLLEAVSDRMDEGVAGVQAARPVVKNKEQLRVRESDLDEWKKTLREIVAENKPSASRR